MCRQNQLLGCILAAFGVGVLIGTWISGNFLCHCLGIGTLLGGISMICKK